MNIEEQWKKLEGEQDKDLSGMLNLDAIRKSLSRNPLVQIKKNLLINAILGIVIGIGYIIVLILYPLWQLFICFGIILFFTIWAVKEGIVLYRRIIRPLAGRSMLLEMEHLYNNLQRWMRIQKRLGLLLYPVSVIGGAVLGTAIVGESPDELFQNPVLLIVVLVTISIMIPTGFYLSKWMFRKAFGQYAEQLNDNIRELKEEKGNKIT